MTTVINADGTLAGILTDGDLRRLREKHGGKVVDMKLADCITRNPQTIGPNVLASEALTLMEKRRITCVIVVDAAKKVQGVVHLHDLWGMQLL
jgi:arabinose-5-phosphate isomerase